MLVNNAGGYWNTRHVTADGLERTFALNHLAPFLLTDLLLDRLKANGRARVVTVASGAHTMGRIDFDDLQGERSYSGSRAYNQSKLANVLFTYELARRLEGSGVTANALHPGVVRTGFGADDPGTVQRLLVPFLRGFMKSPAQGAATSIHLASAPDLEASRAGTSRRASPSAPPGQLRRGRRGTAVAGERRPGRPAREPLNRLRRAHEWSLDPHLGTPRPRGFRSGSESNGHACHSGHRPHPYRRVHGDTSDTAHIQPRHPIHPRPGIP